MMVDGCPRKTATTPTNDNISAISLVWVNPLPVSLRLSCLCRVSLALSPLPMVKSRSFIVYCNLFHSYYYYWNVVGISYCCAAGQTFSTEQRNNNNDDGCLVESIHREGWANTNKEHHQKNGLWLESSWARRNLKIETLCLEWCSIKHRVTNSYL